MYTALEYLVLGNTVPRIQTRISFIEDRTPPPMDVDARKQLLLNTNSRTSSGDADNGSNVQVQQGQQIKPMIWLC